MARFLGYAARERVDDDQPELTVFLGEYVDRIDQGGDIGGSGSVTRGTRAEIDAAGQDDKVVRLFASQRGNTVLEGLPAFARDVEDGGLIRP